MKSPFHLIETMRHERGIRHLDRHMSRLRQSAAEFEIHLDEGHIRNEIRRACQHFAGASGTFRVRLAVFGDGRSEIAIRRLPPLPGPPRQVKISGSRIRSIDVERRHKTSRRDLYDMEYRLAAEQGLFEVIYLNEADLVAEGSRANVIVETNGEWLTPPVDDGALPGVYRSFLIDEGRRPREVHLSEADLFRADRVFVCNAVYGIVEVELIDSSKFAPH